MRRLMIGILVVVLSLGAIAYSFARKFPVYEEDLDPEEFAIYEEISEGDLVYDATSSGIFRSEKTGRLVSTYDRSQPRGRQACPT